MKITLKHDLKNIDWKELADVYERAPLGKRDVKQLKRAFQKSWFTCIAMHGKKIIGAGRIISDGEYYMNIYDIAVLPEFQGKQIGNKIMAAIIKRAGQKFMLLTTTVGKEGFYHKLGFRKHRAAMAIYPRKRLAYAKKHYLQW
ncbi:GNAT family N-acetyltransferase [Elusimicrobiota bacterium]